MRIEELEIVKELKSTNALMRELLSVMGAQLFQQDFLPVTAPGQTAFTLSKSATQVSGSLFYVNGIKKTYGTGYSISGTALTYIGAPLAPGDTLEILYHYL